MSKLINQRIIIALFILVILYVYNKNQQLSLSNISELIPENEEEVVIYSRDWCSYCKQAKNYFRRNKIKFTEYDIDKDANAKIRYNKMNATGVPIIIANNKIIMGFSINQFREIYP